MRRRPVADDLNAVRGATHWIDEGIAEAGAPDDIRYNIEVCLEEALSNLIIHGRTVDGEKDIAVAFETDGDRIVIRVSDRCEPFDAARAPPPAKPTRDDMHAGGQGLRLMHAFATDLAYATVDGRNELTMSFHPAHP